MNRIILAIVVTLVLAVSSCQEVQRSPRTESGSLLGTWELASYKYGNQTEFTDYPEQRRRIKMVSGTHFIWVEFPIDTKEIEDGAGGSYTLEGNAYTESIDFAMPGMTSYLGKKQVFSVRVEDDTYHQSGTLSDGLKIEEVWHRVK